MSENSFYLSSTSLCDISPHYLLRVASLPLTWLGALALPSVAAHFKAVYALEQDLLTRRNMISELLFDVARAAVELGLDHANIIHLKRTLYNLRIVPDDMLAPVIDTIPKNSRTLIKSYADDVARLLSLKKQARAVYAADIIKSRLALRELVAMPSLNAAVAAANPALLRAFDIYRKCAPTALDKHARKAEKSCAKLVYRALGRTTPLSGLATVGFGFWTSEQEEHIGFALDDLSPSSRVRLNPVIAMAIARSLEAKESLLPFLNIYVNASAQDDAGTLKWLRQKMMHGTGGWIRVASREEIARARFTLSLQHVLNLVRDTFPPRFQNIADRLALDVGRKSQNEVVDFLLHLRGVGILEMRLPVPDLCDNHLASLVAVLPSGIDEHIDRSRQLLLSCGLILATFRDAGADERLILRKELEAHLAVLATELDIDFSDLGRLTIFEDVALHSRALVLDETLKPDLADGPGQLASLASLFDIGVSIRSALTDHFLEAYGPDGSVSLIDLHIAMRRKTAEWTGQPERLAPDDNPSTKMFVLPGFQSARIDRIAASQQAVFKLLAGMIRAAGGAEEVRIDERMLADCLAPVADLLATRGSITLFLQPQVDAKRFVVNQVFPGIGKSISRFAPMFDVDSNDSGHQLLKSIRAWHACLEEQAGAKICDINTSLGHAASIRRSHGAFEIALPGAVGRLPSDYELPLGCLTVRYNKAEDRLSIHNDKLATEVAPVELGFLHSSALPSLTQLLGQCSPFVTHPYLELLWDYLMESRADITRTPRLLLGSLVVKRQSWWITAASLPRRVDNTSDVDWAFQVTRWRATHEIPSKVILRQFTAQDMLDTMGGSVDGAGKVSHTSATRGRFPLLLDFDSHFSLVLFDDIIKGRPKKLVLEEFSGHEDGLKIGGKPHTSELVVEIVNNR